MLRRNLMLGVLTTALVLALAAIGPLARAAETSDDQEMWGAKSWRSGGMQRMFARMDRFRAFVEDLDISEDQKAQLQDLRQRQRQELIDGFRDILTPEQQEKIKQAREDRRQAFREKMERYCQSDGQDMPVRTGRFDRMKERVRFREELNITPDQQEQIKELFKQRREARDEAMRAIFTAEQWAKIESARQARKDAVKARMDGWCDKLSDE